MLLLIGFSITVARVAAQPVTPRLLVDVEDRADEFQPWTPVAVGGLAFSGLEEVTEGASIYLDDAVGTSSLWRSDGTQAGTYDVLPEDVAIVQEVDTLGNVLIFGACRRPDEPPEFADLCSSVSQIRLWQSDGTVGGTFPLLPEDDAGPRDFGEGVTVPERGLFFFIASDAQGVKLWVTDGSRGGARPVVDLTALGVIRVWQSVSFGGRFVFLAYSDKGTPDLGYVLVESDGTPEGTGIFQAPFDGSVLIRQILVDGDRLYAVIGGPEREETPGSSGRRLWTLWRGPAPDRLRKVGDLGYHDDGAARSLEGADGRVFVKFREASSDFELWGSDGTAAGTGRLAAYPPERSFQAEVFVDSTSLPGKKALLRLWDEDHGWEPWESDGSPEGTRRIADLCPGPCDSFPRGQGPLDGAYLLTADDGTHGRGVWRWSPSNGDVERFADVCQDQCAGVSSVAARRGDRLFLRTFGQQDEPALWSVRTDGTDPRLAADLSGFDLGPFGTSFGIRGFDPLQIDATWYFWARDPDDRVGLWAVDLSSTAGPPPPDRPPLTSAALPGFDVWVEITPGAGDPIPGRAESECIPETLCVSGSIPGRSEVFVRVVGPKPNGRLWPTLVKFSTSTVEVWIEQRSTGLVRYYRMEGASPGSSDLPGLFDRDGFPPG